MKWNEAVKRTQRGFSLIELMVVVAILLLLSAIAIPRYLTAQQKAYEASAVSFLRTVQTEQEAYRLANGQYAANFQQLGLYALGPSEPQLKITEPILNAHSIRIRSSADAPFAMWMPPVFLAPAPDPQTQQTQTQQGGQYSGGTQQKQTNPQGAPGSGPAGAGASGTGSGGGTSGSSSSGGGSTGGGTSSTSGSSTGSSTSGGGTSGSSSQPSSGSQTPGGSGGSSPSLGGGSGSSGSGRTLPLNIVMKHNFLFEMHRPTLTSFNVSVEPLRDRGFSRFFYMDQSGLIRSEIGKFATANSPAL